MIASYSTLIKQNNQFLPFSRRMRPFGKNFLYHLLLNVMRYAYVKFTLLDFIGKKMPGKRGKPNIPFETCTVVTSLPIWNGRKNLTNRLVEKYGNIS